MLIAFFYLFCILEHCHNKKLEKNKSGHTLVIRGALTPGFSYETGCDEKNSVMTSPPAEGGVMPFPLSQGCSFWETLLSWELLGYEHREKGPRSLGASLAPFISSKEGAIKKKKKE